MAAFFNKVKLYRKSQELQVGSKRKSGILNGNLLPIVSMA